jgi:hypothetical protein
MEELSKENLSKTKDFRGMARNAENELFWVDFAIRKAHCRR